MGNVYTEDHMMHTFSENSQQGVKYSSRITIQQPELIREEKLIDKNHYLYLTYRLII